jgi:hypothetical protein
MDLSALNKILLTKALEHVTSSSQHLTAPSFWALKDLSQQLLKMGSMQLINTEIYMK